MQNQLPPDNENNAKPQEVGGFADARVINEGEKVFHANEVARIRAEHERTQMRLDALLDALLDRSITKDEYDKKLQELKDRQYRLNLEVEEHIRGDHQYHIHVATVLKLCRRMGKTFERSEPEEKKAILGFLLLKAEASGKNPTYTLKNHLRRYSH